MVRGVATGGILVYIPSQNQSLEIILCTNCSRCRQAVSIYRTVVSFSKKLYPPKMNFWLRPWSWYNIRWIKLLSAKWLVLAGRGKLCLRWCCLVVQTQQSVVCVFVSACVSVSLCPDINFWTHWPLICTRKAIFHYAIQLASWSQELARQLPASWIAHDRPNSITLSSSLADRRPAREPPRESARELDSVMKLGL